MNNENSKQLQSMIGRRTTSALKLQRILGIPVTVINTFTAGIPIKRLQEEKIDVWVGANS